MVEAAARQHQAVEMRDRQADPLAADWLRSMRLALRAVPIQLVAFPPEEGRRAIGLAVDHIGDVAQHRGIEEAVDRVVVVEAAVVPALHLVARRHRIGIGGLGLAHGRSCRDLEQSTAVVAADLVCDSANSMRKIPTNSSAAPRKAELPLDLSGPHITPGASSPHRLYQALCHAIVAASSNPANRCRRRGRWPSQTGFRRNAVTYRL